MNIVVYCSSRAGLGREYEEIAESLGKWIGGGKHTLVYGGVNAGLMHTTAQAAHDAGAKVVGVVPEVFRHRVDEVCDNVIFTADLNERKAKMIELADVFIVLPGGIGSIDEWIATLSHIMVMETVNPDVNKPIIVLNYKGVYDGMLQQLSDTNESIFARGKNVDRSIPVDSVSQMIDVLQSL